MTRASLAAAATAFLLALGSSAPPAFADGRDWTGQPAPAVHAQDGVNGIAPGTTLESLRGKVVLMKFFFVGCPACQASMPAFQRLHDRYAPRGAVVVGIDPRDTRYSLQAHLASLGYTFPVLIDPQAAGRYGVQTYPTNYVVGADGVVKAYLRWDQDFPTSLIERELSQGSRHKNVEELGSVPPALERAKAAAAANDYGEVLRVVEPHVENAADDESTRQAAKRIQAIAVGRFQRRVDRIQGAWAAADYRSAYAAVKALAEDFRGTSRQAWADQWVASFRTTAQVKSLGVD
jgi:peroxiredoxin